jgi:hypothetical protein
MFMARWKFKFMRKLHWKTPENFSPSSTGEGFCVLCFLKGKNFQREKDLRIIANDSKESRSIGGCFD